MKKNVCGISVSASLVIISHFVCESQWVMNFLRESYRDLQWNTNHIPHLANLSLKQNQANHMHFKLWFTHFLCFCNFWMWEPHSFWFFYGTQAYIIKNYPSVILEIKFKEMSNDVKMSNFYSSTFVFQFSFNLCV